MFCVIAPPDLNSTRTVISPSSPLNSESALADFTTSLIRSQAAAGLRPTICVATATSARTRSGDFSSIRRAALVQGLCGPAGLRLREQARGLRQPPRALHRGQLVAVREPQRVLRLLLVHRVLDALEGHVGDQLLARVDVLDLL